MKTSHGVIQGYNGIAMVDDKHQLIVGAQAFGEGQEYGALKPMIDTTRKNFQAVNEEEDVFQDTKLTADSGFNNKKNMEMLGEQSIDAYVADREFRKRDSRFDNAGRYKERHRKEKARLEGRRRLFTTEDFSFDPDMKFCRCPAGKRMYRGGKMITKEYLSYRFKGRKTDCRVCHLRSQCLRNPETSEIRQVAYFVGRSPNSPETFAEKVKRKIDSPLGKLIYSKRIATAEPPFANICHTLGLDRFSL